MLYGSLPEDLGLIDLNPDEMMFWLYCPIKVPYGEMIIPDNLKKYWRILNAISHQEMVNKYVYLTAKTLYVTPDNIGNRPGWHSDGFGSEDVNYIWYDRSPTQFVECPGFEMPDNCADAMELMTLKANCWPVHTFPNKHLLRLTSANIHRCPVDYESGMRTFVKVSISTDRYNLKGNSINHGLPKSHWPLYDRRSDRNHPHDTAERYDALLSDSYPV
jgi:hypothetical protein